MPVSLAVQNDGAAEDRFVGANTPIARSAEVHRASLVHGGRETAPLSEGIAIPTNVTSTLQPGKNTSPSTGSEWTWCEAIRFSSRFASSAPARSLSQPACDDESTQLEATRYQPGRSAP